jgi:hypothetical protein
MKPHTVFLGKLFGLYTMLISVWMLANRQAAIATIQAMLEDRPLMLVVAIIAVVGGLALVLGHNIWSGGALTILITLLGWVVLVRGVLLLFLTSGETHGLLEAMQLERFFYVYLSLPLILGAGLTYLAFSARRAEENHRVHSNG